MCPTDDIYNKSRLGLGLFHTENGKNLALNEVGTDSCGNLRINYLGKIITVNGATTNVNTITALLYKNFPHIKRYDEYTEFKENDYIYTVEDGGDCPLIKVYMALKNIQFKEDISSNIKDLEEVDLSKYIRITYGDDNFISCDDITSYNTNSNNPLSTNPFVISTRINTFQDTVNTLYVDFCVDNLYEYHSIIIFSILNGVLKTATYSLDKKSIKLGVTVTTSTKTNNVSVSVIPKLDANSYVTHMNVKRYVLTSSDNLPAVCYTIFFKDWKIVRSLDAADIAASKDAIIYSTYDEFREHKHSTGDIITTDDYQFVSIQDKNKLNKLKEDFDAITKDAPVALDSFVELSRALASNPNFATDVTTALKAKSDIVHKHPKSDITDFAHTHPKSEITDFGHTHPKSEITDFGHKHSKSDITDFGHTHSISEIVNLPQSISSYTFDGQPLTNEKTDIIKMINELFGKVDNIGDIGSMPLTHRATFMSTAGSDVMHYIYSNYYVALTPSAPTNGKLGSFYVDKKSDRVTVYNSGELTNANFNLAIVRKKIGEGHYAGSSKFNGPAGVTINHGLNDDYNAYTVIITPTSNTNCKLGDFYVIRNKGSFTVFCTGNDTTTTFDYILFRNITGIMPLTVQFDSMNPHETNMDIAYNKIPFSLATPSSDTKLSVGDYYCIEKLNKFALYCTGSNTTSFANMVIIC